MYSQNLVNLFGKIMPSSTNVKGEVAERTIATSDGTSETTCTCMRVIKFDAFHYCSKDMLLRINLINDPEILSRDISKAHILSIVKAYREYVCDQARGNLSIATIATMNNAETCENALAGAPHGLNEALLVVLLDKRHRLQALRVL